MFTSQLSPAVCAPQLPKNTYLGTTATPRKNPIISSDIELGTTIIFPDNSTRPSAWQQPPLRPTSAPVATTTGGWFDDLSLARALQAMEFEIDEEMVRMEQFNEDFENKEHRASSCYRQMRTLSSLIVFVQVLIMIIMICTDGITSSTDNPMIGPPVTTLVHWGAKESSLIKYKHQWWRTISPIFLHAGLLHIASNAFIQLRVGGYLNRIYGTWKWMFIYMISGIFGNMMSCIFLPDAVGVGSSGAVLGMLSSWMVWLVFRWYGLFSS
jgi:membrane associated rhomboid family serine protease